MYLFLINYSFGATVSMMMVHHPSSSTEISAVNAVSAILPASQTTPPRTEAAKEEETLKSLVDVPQQVMRNVPAQGAAAQHSAVTPTLS